MRLLFALLALLLAVPAAAQLKAHKDRLFAYPSVIEKRLAGRHWIVDYSKERDLIGRDAVPRRRVKDAYVTTGLGFRRKVVAIPVPGGTRKAFSVGAHRNARWTLVYLHGQGGNRRQGVSDYTFGGNFNRLQNLAVANGGRLITPDVVDFGASGTAELVSILTQARRDSPRGALYVACGSMGGRLCWRLLQRGEAATLSGVFLLGAQGDEAFLGSRMHRWGANGVPIVMAIGGSDQVFDAGTQVRFFERLVQAQPDYPARLIEFRSGVHGTPIRMIDWRAELNRLMR